VEEKKPDHSIHRRKKGEPIFWNEKKKNTMALREGGKKIIYLDYSPFWIRGGGEKRKRREQAMFSGL